MADSGSRQDCVLHEVVESRLRRIEDRQDRRPCNAHEERLRVLKESDEEQWKAIDDLRRLVYIGAGAAGVLAFLGSILGGLLKRM